MIYAKRLQAVSVHLKGLLRTFYLFKNNREGQLRRNHTQTPDHPFQAFWSDQGKGFLPVRVSHCKEQARKAADMISVIVSEADHIDRLEAPPFFFYRDLCSLTAVDEQAAPVETGHQRGQITVRKRHHPAASKQTYI